MPAPFRRHLPHLRDGWTGIQEAHETHLPTQQHQAPANSRVPCSYGHPRWTQSAQCTQGQGTQARFYLSQGDQRFPRERRLLRPAEFERVLRQFDERRDRRPVRVLVRSNQHDGARLGIVTPKRFVRMAHDRNHCKRVVRELFRRAWSNLPSVDVVVMIGAGATPERVRDAVSVLFAGLESASEAANQ